MARKRRTPNIKTLRQSVSHLRKQIERIKNMELTVPRDSMPAPTVKSFGSTLEVNGVKYGAKELEKLKGQSRDWQVPVLAELEDRLAREEYRMIQQAQAEGTSVRKITGLSELEVEQAQEGYELLSNEESQKFVDWLNSGSPGIKKWWFYHSYGSDTINLGDIRGFMKYMEPEAGRDIKEVADLYGIFKD